MIVVRKGSSRRSDGGILWMALVYIIWYAKSSRYILTMALKFIFYPAERLDFGCHLSYRLGRRYHAVTLAYQQFHNNFKSPKAIVHVRGNKRNSALRESILRPKSLS